MVFVMGRANPFVLLGDVYFSGTEYSRMLKFSMQTLVTHKNIIFEYCHDSMMLDYAFFSKKPFLVLNLPNNILMDKNTAPINSIIRYE